MSHRGAHPRDAEDFAESALPALREACDDLGWLLGRGYAPQAALKLVGDRRQLSRRQRQAVVRASWPAPVADGRRARLLSPEAPLHGRRVDVDGFNVLVTTEKLVAGGPVFVGRDGAWRDLAGMHGTWRRGGATDEALGALREALDDAAEVVWWLDRPVSNSGRLAARLRAVHPAWRVEVADAVDATLKAAPDVVASADGAVLDHAGAWTVLEARVAARRPQAWVIRL